MARSVHGGGSVGSNGRAVKINLAYLQERLIRSGGGGLKTARITARIGISVFIYSAITVTRDGGAWIDDTEGDDLTANLRNLYEQYNPSGYGANPVNIGEYVGYWLEGDEYVFERSPYRGVYPQ